MNYSSNGTADSVLFELEIKKEKGVKSSVRFIVNDEPIHIDRIDLSSDKARESFLDRCVNYQPGIDPNDLEGRLKRAACMEQQPEAEATGPPTTQQILSQTDLSVIDQAKEILSGHNVLEVARAALEENGLVGEQIAAKAVFLAGVSRLLPKPMAVLIQGSSASGKSYTIKKVASLFPDESKIHATQMTPKALFHMEQGGLKNRFVVAGERTRAANDDTAEATRALREMLSEHELNKLMPVKEGGQIVTRRIHQEGPISYVESTTANNIFEEDLNRMLLIHTDESEEQTRRILDAQPSDQPDSVHLIQTMMRLLEPKKIVIPYSQGLWSQFPAHRLEVRRFKGLVKSTIEASCLLNQHQREFDGQAIIANRQDYEIAREVVNNSFMEQIEGGLSDRERDFRHFIQSSFGNSRFSATQVADREGCPIGRSQTFDLFRSLSEKKHFRFITKIGRASMYELVPMNDVPEGLPTVSQLFSNEGETGFPD